MDDIDDSTLIDCIQTVSHRIRYLETLLSSNTLRDPENIKILIYRFRKAEEELKREQLRRRFKQARSAAR